MKLLSIIALLPHLGPNTVLSSLFSYTLNQCSWNLLGIFSVMIVGAPKYQVIC